MGNITCSCCGSNKDISEMHTNKTCIKCAERRKVIRSSQKYKIRKKLYYQNNKDKAAIYGYEYRRSSIGRYKKTKKAVVRRGIEFCLSYEEYDKKISEPCHYCEDFFPRVEAGIGLDKLNNNLGYTNDNTVSCCEICNKLKNDIFTPEETKAAITAVIKIRMHDV